MYTQMTVAEALAKGYTHVVAEGDTTMSKIEEWDFEENKEWIPVILEPTERTHFTIDPGTIRDLISSHLYNQDEVNDEDGNLDEALAEVDDSYFNQLAEALNKAWSEIHFIPLTDFQLVP